MDGRVAICGGKDETRRWGTGGGAMKAAARAASGASNSFTGHVVAFGDCTARSGTVHTSTRKHCADGKAS